MGQNLGRINSKKHYTGMEGKKKEFSEKKKEELCRQKAQKQTGRKSKEPDPENGEGDFPVCRAPGDRTGAQDGGGFGMCSGDRTACDCAEQKGERSSQIRGQALTEI